MIPVTGFAGKTVAVFGLGETGLVSARALRAGNADVAVWDDNPAARDKARAEGFEPVDLKDADFASFTALVLSPGVPLTHPEPHWTVKLAAAAGVPVIGDTELFVRELASSGTDAKLIAITGTNGKSTTTALVGHLLKSAGRNVRVGGNIGRGVLDLDPPVPGCIYVVEFSSYQIDLTPSLRPDIAVLLNLSPDHLDRHGDMAHYAAVKARVFAKQGVGDVAVIGVDDADCLAIADGLSGAAQVQRISGETPTDEGIFADGGVLQAAEQDGRQEIAKLQGIATLRGAHNGQNAAAAAAIVLALGLSTDELQKGLMTFPGLVHRMEQVGRKGTVLFINDSKATNADAAARALAAFDTIFWIAGGQAKAGGIAPLAEYFPRIRRAYLIGEAMEAFRQTLEGHVETVDAETLEVAVDLAAHDAAQCNAEEVVVLLSPACASFDQFKSFEVRGHRFRELVAALDGVHMEEEAA